MEGQDRYSLVLGDLDIHRGWLEDTERYSQKVEEILDKIARFSTKVFYVPGDTDIESIDIDSKRVVNLDKDYTIIEGSKRVGLIGLGGAPKRSVRTPGHFNYLWNEGDSFVQEELYKKLKINLEKLRRENPDTIILLSHSPPHGVADKSIPFSLREVLDLENLPDTSNSDNGTARANPKHLGSRLLKKFLRENPIDLHIFGHVHKRGGISNVVKGVKAFNVSHLAPSPRKLYGRKLLRIKLSEDVKYNFQSIVNPSLSFEEYLETYL